MHSLAIHGASLPAHAVRTRRSRRRVCCCAVPEQQPSSSDEPQLPPALPAALLGGGARQFVLGVQARLPGRLCTRAAGLTRAQRKVDPTPTTDGFCFACRPGQGRVTCRGCSGSGLLSRAGYARANPVDLKRVVGKGVSTHCHTAARCLPNATAPIAGSKWTALEKTFGWRHFQAVSRKKEGSAQFVELASTCDTNVRFFVNATNLKDRSRWLCGWLEREEMQAASADTGGRCRACSGSGQVACPACSSPDGIVDI